MFSFSCRYIDDIFMTTNRTIDDIKKELDKSANKDINIKINYKFDISVDFLDITITNDNAKLRTSIFHKPVAEPYILPFTSDHPRHIHRNIPYATLLRAARICSNVDDFNTESIRIDVSLLLNNYPPEFISKQFCRFFKLNNAMPVLKQLDEQVYQRLHRTLLHQPTRREKTLAKMMKDPVDSPLVLERKIWDAKLIYPAYLFESGQSIDLPRQFYKWWKTYYAYSGSSVQYVKVGLVPNTNRTLESFLIHKKPPRDILTRMDTL